MSHTNAATLPATPPPRRRTTTRTAPERRISGPVRARREPARTPLVLKALRAVRRLPDARVLDLFFRGRAWIFVVAIALLGLVFLQVSLLKLNTSIGRAVQTAASLERQNASLRGSISSLDSGDRIQEMAINRGMVMPAPGDTVFVDARRASAARAAQSIHSPSPVAQQPDPNVSAPSGAVTTPAAPLQPAVTAPTAPPVTTTPAVAAPPPPVEQQQATTAQTGGVSPGPQ